MRKSDLGPQIHSEGPAKNGFFQCFVQTFEDGPRHRDHFRISVKQMELHGTDKSAPPRRRPGNENAAGNSAHPEVIVVD